MNSYNQDKQSGSRKYSSGGGRGRDSRSSGPREMHKAVCSSCGNNCEVPFKPTGDKPIYCSSCFEKRNGGSSQRPSRGRSSRPSFDRGSRPDNSKLLLEQMTALNSKMDRVLKVLEAGSEKKEIPAIAQIKETIISPKKPKAKKVTSEEIVK